MRLMRFVREHWPLTSRSFGCTNTPSSSSFLFRSAVGRLTLFADDEFLIEKNEKKILREKDASRSRELNALDFCFCLYV